MIIYPDKESVARLERAAADTGRTVEDLATSAVEEAALAWARQNGFPGEQADRGPPLPYIEDRGGIDMATGLREEDLP